MSDHSSSPGPYRYRQGHRRKASPPSGGKIDQEHARRMARLMVGQLSAAEKAAVRLWLAGQTPQQVGNTLRITKGAARDRIERARDKLGGETREDVALIWRLGNQ